MADTDEQALDLAETLPAHALRYLATHAEIHLNVVWRELSDEQWSLRLDGSGGANAIQQTPALRARLLWVSAVNLGSGGRMADAPADFRQMLAAAEIHHERSKLATAATLTVAVIDGVAGLTGDDPHKN